MNKIILFFVLLFSFFFSLSQTTTGKDINTINELSESIHEYTIKEIEINGAELYGYEKDDLIKLLGVSIGDKITVQKNQKISEAINEVILKQQPFFLCVETTSVTKQVNDNIWLKFDIIEQQNQEISDITFSGIKKDEKAHLKGVISSFIGAKLTPKLINLAQTKVKNYFNSTGCNQVEIQTQYKNSFHSKGKIIINFLICKNKKIKIRQVRFLGNYGLSNYELQTIINKTNKNFLLNKLLKILFSHNKPCHTYIQKEYEKILENIILKYKECGYCDAYIKADSIHHVLDINNKNQIDIDIYIEEGHQYKIRNIKWIGNEAYSSDQLNNLLSMKMGDIYNQKKLEERILTDEDAITNLYYNNGYIFSSIVPLEVCRDKNLIDLEIRIYEGKQAIINQVVINGNTNVYENVIRRELLTKPGKLFNKQEIIYSSNKIAQLGCFIPDKINIQQIINNKSGTVDLHYNLTPKDNNQIKVSTGYGQNGIIGHMSLKFSNFSFHNIMNWKKHKSIIPQGDGQSLTLSAQADGRCRKSYRISFFDPWFGGKRPNSFSINSYYMLQKKSVTKNSFDNNNQDKNVQMIGLSLDYKKNLNWPDKYCTVIPELSYQNYLLKNGKNFQKTNNTSNILSVGVTINRNSTNDAIYPKFGSDISISYNASPPYSLVDQINYKNFNFYQKWIEYYNCKFHAKIFIPLSDYKRVKKIPVLMGRIEYGLMKTYNSTNYSLFEDFNMNNYDITNSSTPYNHESLWLRGYGELTAKDFEFKYTRLTLECRYPLFLIDKTSIIYGLAFLESGNILNKDEQFHLNQSTGIGIRGLHPIIGTIGVDWVYKLGKIDKPNNESKTQFHFVFGKEF